MKRIFPLIISGLILLNGIGVAGETSNKAIMDNLPPNPPDMDGPTSPKIGINYTYEFCSTDPDGDNVSYYIDWDDGTTWGWTDFYASDTPYSLSHAWYKSGWYLVKCKANDTHGALSNWSYHLIKIPPRNKIATYNSLFLKLLERFPLLERLLTLLIN